MRWLAGFLVFGLAYALFVSLIFWQNWPTMENPHLYGTLEAERSAPAQDAVTRVIKESLAVTGSTSTYQIHHQSFEFENDLVSAVVVANGHVLILNYETTENQANNIAKEYVGLVSAHIQQKALEHKNQIVLVIFIPLLLLSGFAWLARKIWSWVSALD